MKKLIAILASIAVLACSAMWVSADNESPSGPTPAASATPTASPNTGSHSGGSGGAGETDEEEETTLPEEEEIEEEDVPLATPDIPEELLLAQEEPTEAADYSVVDEIDYTTVSPQTGFAETWDIAGL